MPSLDDLRDAMREFTAERDWERYHDPKSLLLALVGEVGELSALFQWLPASQARNLVGEEPRRLARQPHPRPCWRTPSSVSTLPGANVPGRGSRS